MTYEEASKIVLTKYKNCKITAGLDTPKAFVFAIKPINMKEDIFDNLFSVDKVTGVIASWPMSLHAQEYREAIKHPIYLEPR